jgi:hypothetical protein
MTYDEAHACALNLVTELIRAGRIGSVSGADPKDLANFQATQIRELHEQLSIHFANFDISGTIKPRR